MFGFSPAPSGAERNEKALMHAEELGVAFAKKYDSECDGVMCAPGRVNLIGEHTDYNDGFVLPCAIELKNSVAFRKREDGVVRVSSLNYGTQGDQFSVRNEIQPGQHRWANYVRAVIYVLKRRGHRLRGADLLMFGDIPQGAGLSSSAALEVCVGACFSEVSELGLSATKLAEIGQQAENEFIGCQCGIMDQLISALGRPGHALLIDCQDNSSESIPVPDELAIFIANSNFKRELVDSEYNTRRQDCEDAALALETESLRHASLAQLQARRASMSANAFKRASHVISENRRTRRAADALKSRNYEGLFDLINQAHASIRDEFEIVVPQTDGLVKICRESLGPRGAARQTGGGFGGCVVVVCERDAAQKAMNAIEEQYEARFGLRADCYVATPSEGLHRAI